MAIFEQEHRPPEPDEFDTGYAVVRAALGGVPLLGSAAQELLQRIMVPPLARRQQEWAEGIGAAVRRLEEQKGVTPEQLRDNPAFVDAVLAATQAAIRTSQEEKRLALLNATVNSALLGAPEVAGMHRSGSLQTMMSTDGPLQKRTTETGDRFLKFIESPF